MRQEGKKEGALEEWVRQFAEEALENASHVVRVGTLLEEDLSHLTHRRHLLLHLVDRDRGATQAEQTFLRD